MKLMQPDSVEPETTHLDTDCLALSIWNPEISGVSIPRQGLPVFVWIHGGGFAGASAPLHFELECLVRVSLDNGKSRIGVPII